MSQGRSDMQAAQSLFVNMLGSEDAECNIKQFASCVEKLGYEWDAMLLRNVFDRIDNSGDGLIDLQEFKQGIQLVGGAQMFKEMDADNSNTIEMNEFIAACRKVNPKFDMNKARTIFQEVDVDGSGALDILEFLDAINQMANGASGGLGAVGFAAELKNQMGALRRKMEEAEKRMLQLKSGLKDRAEERDRSQQQYDTQRRAARAKQAEVDRIKAEMDPYREKVENAKGKLGPLRQQLEENMKEFGAKRAELDEAFQEHDWTKIHPISNELTGLKRTIADLEGKLGITQAEHDKMMEKFTALGASHGVNAEQLRQLHNGVEDSQNSLDAALAAHADDLEAYKATSAEYRQLKRNLLQCQIKEKKAEISACLGRLNGALAQHRRAIKKIKALCEEFEAAENRDDFETTGNCSVGLMESQKMLDEADGKRAELANELKRLRALLADEKKNLADLDDLPPPSAT